MTIMRVLMLQSCTPCETASSKADRRGTYHVALLQQPLQLAGIPLGEVNVLSNMGKALSNSPIASLPVQ